MAEILPISRRKETTEGSQMTPELAKSYAACRQVAKQSRSSFLASFLLLDKPKREAMYVLYAFCRHCDDLADSDAAVATKQTQLQRWREDFQASVARTPLEQSHPDGLGQRLLPALIDVMHRFEISSTHLEAVIRGVEMDLQPPNYETFEELAGYCHLVASAVGKACLPIWGYDHSEEAMRLAEDCGLAFQLTNMIRDIGEDGAMQRIYLPREDLAKFDVDPASLFAGQSSESLVQLVYFELDRADQKFRSSQGLFDCLYPQGRRIFAAMHTTYWTLARKLRRKARDITSRRIRLSRWRKAWLATRYGLIAPRLPRSAVPANDQ